MQDFKFEYTDQDDIPLELFLRGMVSLTLTCVNIICIIMVGVLMLLIKQVHTILQQRIEVIFKMIMIQVTPESIPQRNASFWKNDIMLNKEYEKSFQEKDVSSENISSFKPKLKFMFAGSHCRRSGFIRHIHCFTI